MRRWRQAQGRTLTSVADQIGITKGHLSHVENAHANLSLPHFLDFCNAIDVPSSKILRDSVLPKDRDFGRLADDLRKAIGIDDLNWLARLSSEDARAALEGARIAVDLQELRKSKRAKAKPKADVRPIPRKR
jgi:transcriptional regulator with XRE-family HTH domain